MTAILYEIVVNVKTLISQGANLHCSPESVTLLLNEID